MFIDFSSEMPAVTYDEVAYGHALSEQALRNQVTNGTLAPIFSIPTDINWIIFDHLGSHSLSLLASTCTRMFELVIKYFGPAINTSGYIESKRRSFSTERKNIWKPMYDFRKSDKIRIIRNVFSCFTCFYASKVSKRNGRNFDNCEICLKNASIGVTGFLTPANN